jgi:hypothetical membrane protein
MHYPFALLAVTAYLLICLRLLTYQRNGARHRNGVAWVAWGLLVLAGWSAIDFLLRAPEVSAVEALRAVLICIFVFCVRGNVARLLRREASPAGQRKSS